MSEDFDEKYYRRKKREQKKRKNDKLKNDKKRRKYEESTEDDNTFEELDETNKEYTSANSINRILKPFPNMLLIKDKPNDEEESNYLCVIC